MVGGSNAAWRPEHAAALGAAVRGAAAVMLQREVPEFVNEAVAAAAAQAGVPVMQVRRPVALHGSWRLR